MKKCIVVSDSFKGTLSSQDICAIAWQSIPRFFPNCQVVTVPVADGGEGTVDCFVQALRAQPVEVEVSGPFGEPVRAVYCRSGNRAVVEMASAAGLPMARGRLDPEKTTTYGVGQLIRHAVEAGCTEILLGLGGSCTNDGGCGCAAALGTVFYREDGSGFLPTGGTLKDVRSIDTAETRRLLKGVSITAMCDVDNPLCGPNGAAHVFGPQKGADPEIVRRLDEGLGHLDRCVQKGLGLSLGQLPGAGAAGGMGMGCVALLGAQLRSGIEAVLDMVEFDRLLEGAELVITGEGRIDFQSVQGKVISGVARRTAPRRVPLVAVVGGVGEGAETAYDIGVTALFGIDRGAEGFEKSAGKARENYQKTLEDILRLLRAAGG